MYDTKLPSPHFISKPQALQKLADRLLKEEIIAVDTESNSLYAYQEQVCLIQFSTTREDYLVDPLALDNLSPLEPIFTNPDIEKVFHAAEYDLICLKRDFDFRVTNLFDTMVAATILGREEVGLGSMLENEFGIQVDKRFQRADWGQRPLPPELLAYARLDTHYLIPLRDKLAVDLQVAERGELAAEDFRRLAQIGERNISPITDHHNFVTESCWRISGSYELSPQGAAVLLELCRYRDRIARASNKPLFKVISDATLFAIAQALPSKLEELKDIPGMTHGQIRRHGEGILNAVKQGLDSPPQYHTRAPRPDDQYLARMDDLRKWRKVRAKELGVKSDVILPRDLLNAIADHDPDSLDELRQILQDAPWRFEHFGEDILKAVNHKNEHAR